MNSENYKRELTVFLQVENLFEDLKNHFHHDIAPILAARIENFFLPYLRNLIIIENVCNWNWFKKQHNAKFESIEGKK